MERIQGGLRIFWKAVKLLLYKENFCDDKTIDLEKKEDNFSDVLQALCIKQEIDSLYDVLKNSLFEQEKIPVTSWNISMKEWKEIPSQQVKHRLCDILLICNYHSDSKVRQKTQYLIGLLLSQGATAVCPFRKERLLDNTIRIAFLGRLNDPVGNYFLHSLFTCQGKPGKQMIYNGKQIQQFIFCSHKHVPRDYRNKNINLFMCADFSSKELAQAIYNHQIDILVDLQGACDGNRLDVFPFQSALLQLSWAGYPGSSGMSSVHAKVTDVLCDVTSKQDEEKAFSSMYTEKLLYMPLNFSFLCFNPDESHPVWKTSFTRKKRRAKDRFARRGMERITIMVMGIAYKCNIKVWTLLSQACNQALNLRDNLCIEIVHKTGSETSISSTNWKQIKKLFSFPNVRIRSDDRHVSLVEFCSLHRRIDLIFDTFPYAGTTTVFVASALGVPVVTWYAGEKGPHSHNTAGSILLRLNNELVNQCCVAISEQELITKTVYLAITPEIRRILRKKLPVLLRNSNLCKVEPYREAWTSLVVDEWMQRARHSSNPSEDVELK